MEYPENTIGEKPSENHLVSKTASVIFGTVMLVLFHLGSVDSVEANNNFGYTQESNYDEIDYRISQIIKVLKRERDFGKRQELLNELLKLSQIKKNLSGSDLNSGILNGTYTQISFGLGDKHKMRKFIVENRQKNNSYTYIVNCLKENKYPYYYYEERRGFKKIEKVKTLEGVYYKDGSEFRGFLKGGERQILILKFGDKQERFEFLLKRDYISITWIKNGETISIPKELIGEFFLVFGKKDSGEEIGFSFNFN